MKNFKTVCITITTLIAVFFFTIWVNQIRPSYEWQEEIFTRHPLGLVTCSWLEEDCYIYCEDIEIETRFYTQSGSYSEKGTAEINLCYIKEKVRIK